MHFSSLLSVLLIAGDRGSCVLIRRGDHNEGGPRNVMSSSSSSSCFSSSTPTALHPSSFSRRDVLFLPAAVSYAISLPSYAYTPDSDKLRESLYLISRVQEATVQQERFVNTNNRQEELRQKMKFTLLLVEKNYHLLDQINYCSAFISPSDAIVEAVAAGNEAVDALQNAIDFVNDDLKSGPLKSDQKEYLTTNLQQCRDKLFVFLQYIPQDKLEAARRRVEDENIKNREEFDSKNLGSDAGVYNPVMLPWKTQ